MFSDRGAQMAVSSPIRVKIDKSRSLTSYIWEGSAMRWRWDASLLSAWKRSRVGAEGLFLRLVRAVGIPTPSKRISDPKPRDGTTTKDEQELVQSGSVFLYILMNRIKTKE